jgi:hypothetical protein
MKTTTLILTVILTVILSVIALASACGGSSASVTSDANSPTSVSKRFVEAARKKDVSTFKSLLAKKSLDTMEKDAKEAGTSADAMIKEFLAQDLFSGQGELEFRNEAVNGDRATVEFKDTSGKWNKNDLVKENGAWKVSLD